MTEEIIERIKELTGAKEVFESDSLRGVGIDSLAYIQLIVELEEKYKIEFGDDRLMLDEVGTVGGFASLAEELCEKER